MSYLGVGMEWEDRSWDGMGGQTSYVKVPPEESG